MALLSDMAPIRGRERLGERGRDAVMVWDKSDKKRDCPSWTGKADSEQESRAKRGERGQDEGRCEYGGGETVMYLLSKKE